MFCISVEGQNENVQDDDNNDQKFFHAYKDLLLYTIVNFTSLRKTLLHKKYLGISIFNKINL